MRGALFVGLTNELEPNHAAPAEKGRNVEFPPHAARAAVGVCHPCGGPAQQRVLAFREDREVRECLTQVTPLCVNISDTTQLNNLG